jgi:DNA-binding Lrp family transcriptional regulator
MIDRTDARLLAELQRNSSITAQDLGDLLGLSPSQAARRRQKLESDKVIVGYRAEIAPEKVGLGVQVFIEVQMAAHTPEAAKSFASLVATLREVVGCWTLTGTSDYLLRVWCAAI